MHKALTYFFFFIVSFGFSNEMLQGTLTNGIRYYIVPDSEENEEYRYEDTPSWAKSGTITLIVKKPANWRFIDFNLSIRNAIVYRETYNSLSISVDYIEPDHFKNQLDSFQTWLANKALPEETIEELQADFTDEYESFPDDHPTDPYACKIMNLLFGCNLDTERYLFAQEKTIINKTVQNSFHPSCMALIISGTFPPITHEELEAQFGSIKNEGICVPLSPQFTSPMVIRCQNLDSDDFPSRASASNVYKYYYRFDPSYRNYVLNDLFLIIGAMAGGFREYPLCEMMPLGYFLSYWPVSWPVANEVLFDIAKTWVRESYEHSSDLETSCRQHFLSGISAPLSLHKKNQLQELETITLDDLNLFIEQNMKDLFTCPILDI